MSDAPAPRASIELTPATLGRLDPRVSIPRYDRSRLGRGIVHIGVGGFHRAHQAVYLDDLCARGETGWSIAGAGVLPGDKAMADALGAQSGLYTLVTRDQAGIDVRVIGTITDYLHASPRVDALAARIADPSTRIVSLTVTEGGYPHDEASMTWTPSPDGVLPPAFEAIARGLRGRRDAGLGGLTVQSCDNVMHNGKVAKAVVLGVADAVEPGLAAWVERNVSFPSSMVDRITPATSDTDRAFLRDEYGLADRWPVVCETFIQWVIEDEFAAGRPRYEDAGALFTTDVRPYEILKLRLLNAGHSILAYLGTLAGIVHVFEVMADPVFARYLERFHTVESSPSLPHVAGVDVPAYAAKVRERFANPTVRDQVARIAQDGSGKFPKFLIPTIEAQLDAGGPVGLSALALAGWCQYLTGRDEQGREIAVQYDSNQAEAQRFAQASVADPAAFLGYEAVFGERVGHDPRFVAAFADALREIRAVGARAAVERALAG